MRCAPGDLAVFDSGPPRLLGVFVKILYSYPHPPPYGTGPCWAVRVLGDPVLDYHGKLARIGFTADRFLKPIRPATPAELQSIRKATGWALLASQPTQLYRRRRRVQYALHDRQDEGAEAPAERPEDILGRKPPRSSRVEIARGRAGEEILAPFGRTGSWTATMASTSDCSI
jgi:hypothetical protein